MATKFNAGIEVEEIDINEAIKCGLKQEFVQAEDQETGDKIVVYSGAGCGSPWISGNVEIGGETKHYRIHVREIVKAFHEKATA